MMVELLNEDDKDNAIIHKNGNKHVLYQSFYHTSDRKLRKFHFRPLMKGGTCGKR